MTITPYRVLVTGSRTWTDKQAIWQALATIARELPADRDLIVVEGACPNGADRIAYEWASSFGAIVEAHPALWRNHGVYNPQAGLARNRRMVELGADVVLAFIRNGSRGASHCADLAEQAGIPVKRWTA